jgi:hypothetical protein
MQLKNDYHPIVTGAASLTATLASFGSLYFLGISGLLAGIVCLFLIFPLVTFLIGKLIARHWGTHHRR